jgi:exodeoxyribonuclease VII large subunit
LAAEGLFEYSRKRSIPPQPKLIGIVTSPIAAALQDMLNTLKNRFPMAEVVFSPASVQGDTAPAQIVKALERLNKFVHPDVILIGRGGGSLEDLWAFNDEQVVRAVAASEAPVISGVGHETDFTLTDFAADMRAPTPTGAAVMAVPDINDVKNLLNGWNQLLEQTILNIFDEQRSNLVERKNRLDLLSPGWQIKQRMQRLDNSSLRMDFIVNEYFLRQRQQLELAEEKIISSDPSYILDRGFAIVEDNEGSVITTIKQVQLHQDISVYISDGTISADVTSIEEKE